MSYSPSAVRIQEVGRCIRALHEHMHSFVGTPNGTHVYGMREAIRCLGERKRRMKDELGQRRIAAIAPQQKQIEGAS